MVTHCVKSLERKIHSQSSTSGRVVSLLTKLIIGSNYMLLCHIVWHVIQKKCGLKLKMVIDGEKFCEIKTQMPEWNIVDNGEPSNWVCFRMALSCFFAVGIIKHYEPKWIWLQSEIVINGG
jgi:hypothetical protein